MTDTKKRRVHLLEFKAMVGIPFALCSSGTEFSKDSLEKTLGIEFKNRGSADQLHET